MARRSAEAISARVVAWCRHHTPENRTTGDETVVLPLVEIDDRWAPDLWLRANEDLVDDVVALTSSLTAPVAAVVAATAMLEIDRYRLVRVWNEHFLPRELEVVAAAAGQRLPSVS